MALIVLHQSSPLRPGLEEHPPPHQSSRVKGQGRRFYSLTSRHSTPRSFGKRHFTAARALARNSRRIVRGPNPDVPILVRAMKIGEHSSVQTSVEVAGRGACHRLSAARTRLVGAICLIGQRNELAKSKEAVHCGKGRGLRNLLVRARVSGATIVEAVDLTLHPPCLIDNDAPGRGQLQTDIECLEPFGTSIQLREQGP